MKRLLQSIRAKLRGVRGEKHIAAVIEEFSHAEAKLAEAIEHLDAELYHNVREQNRLSERNADLFAQQQRAVRVKGRIRDLVA